MAEQVQYRRDTAANLANFTGASGEVVVDTTNNRLQVHDGSTKGGWPAAREDELLTEQMARATAFAAEANAREQGDATNAEAITANAAGIAAETFRAEAAEAALSTAVAGCATTAQLAANTQFANALFPPERPGDGNAYFTKQVTATTPLPGNFLPVAPIDLQQGAEGLAANIVGDGYLVSREFYPIEPNRSYLARVAFSVTQLGLGSLITFGVFQYDAAKALIGEQVFASFTSIYPASGRQTAQAIVTRTTPLPTGEVGVDPATRYVRLVVQNTDLFQYVAVEVMQWADVTNSSVFAPNVATLQAQIGQLSSQLAAMTQNFYIAGCAKISDADYAAVAADGGVEITAMTQSRKVTLPPLASMPPNMPFSVADGAGNVNGTIVINVIPAAGDLFNGKSAANGGGITIQAQYGTISPRAGSTSWLL